MRYRQLSGRQRVTFNVVFLFHSFFPKTSQVKTNQIYGSFVEKNFISATAKKTLSKTFAVGEELWPKLTCCQANVPLILEQECFNTKFKK